MVVSRSALVVTVVAACGLLACSGGGGGGTTQSTPPPPPTGIGGTARASAANAADGDTNDPNASVDHNDSAGAAQLLPSVVTVGGYVSTTADMHDWYRATFAAGQTVTLQIADASQDLDLYVLSDPTTIVTSSATLDATESVRIPAGGQYYVVVEAFSDAASNASNYVLTLGQAGSASAGAPGADEVDASGEFVPGDVIVRFRDDLPSASGTDSREARAASVGLTAREGAPGREMLMELGTGAARSRAFATLGLPESDPDLPAAALVDVIERERRDTVRVVRALRARGDVATADLNYIRYAAAVPNDEYYKYQWHYPQMKLPQAWDVTTGTPASGQVIVAVVDTGVLTAHPDLAGKLVTGYDFVSNVTAARDGNGIDSNPNDPGTSPSAGQSSWHGSHVAGTIAAASNNGIGVAGVSWGAKIMPLRVLGLNGSGTSYDIIQAVKYAARLANDSGTLPAQKADVINLSLGAVGGSSTTEQALYDQVRAAGVIVVAAAGNNGKNELFYPASYNGVISVSAVDMLGQRAPYSNFSSRVDVAAPGGDMSADLDTNGFPDGVLSLVGNDSDASVPLKYDYWFMNGTSMASPHMAGVVALMRAVCPTMTPAQLDTLLSGGTITSDLGASGRDDVFGYGLIDAFAAVQGAQQACAAPVSTSIGVSPGRVDFGAALTAATVTLSKQGDGTLGSVTVSKSAGASWLTVPAAAGFGAYTFTVNRAGLTAGSYSAVVTFTAAPATVSVPVTLQVGTAAASSNDAGHLYILLVDGNLATVGQVDKDPTAGAYAYTFPSVTTGTYYVIAGTDADDDGAICDAGESCGAYPTLGQPAALDASAAPRNIDFLVGFGSGLDGASAGPGVDGPGFTVPPGGFKLLRAPKNSAVRP